MKRLIFVTGLLLMVYGISVGIPTLQAQKNRDTSQFPRESSKQMGYVPVYLINLQLFLNYR